MSWSVRMTFNVLSPANSDTFADDLERLFDTLAESSEGSYPAVSGTGNETARMVEIDLDTHAEDEVTALRTALNLAVEAFRATGIEFSHLEHAELARERADQPVSA